MTDTKHETKQNASHTPGPWIAERLNPSGGILIEAGKCYGGIIATVWQSMKEHEANALLIAAAPDLLDAAKTALSRIAWVIDTVTRAVGHLNIDDIPQEAIDLLDEVTSSEYFKDDIEQVQHALAEATGRAA